MYRKYLFFLFSILFSYYSFSQNPGYQIKISIEGMKDKVVYLSGYYGTENIIYDSAKVKNGKLIVFTSEDKVLPSGLYELTNKEGYIYMDFLIDQSRSFSVSTSLNTISSKREYINSDENLFYFEFLKMMQLKGEISTAYLKSMIEISPNSLLSKYLKANFLQVEVPDIFYPDGVTLDTIAQYQYWKKHFFDYVDFSDSRLLRVESDFRISDYFLEYVIQNTDEIIREIDNFISKSKINPEINKYCLSYLYRIFDDCNPSHDPILVYLYDTYCQNGTCDWLDEFSFNRFKKEVNRKRKILPGQIVPPLVAYDAQHKSISTKDINHKYIILWFWDPDCDECVELTPQLRDFYDIYKDYYDLEIYAVSITYDYDRWDDFILKNQLTWINVSYAIGEPNYDFVDYFDLITTPGIYIINSKHKIIARQFPLDELHEKLGN